MVQDIKITPGSGIPQILFVGSGALAPNMELNVQQVDSRLSYGSTDGELFSISPGLQSGVIFAVKDISGLDHISVHASGDVHIGEYSKKVILYKGLKTPTKANTDASTITFDLNESNLHTVTLGGNRTLVVSNATAGQRFMLRLTQDGTGSRTITSWFSTIKWAGGSAPTLTTTASKADVFGFICTGVAAYDGFVVGQNI